MSVLLLLCQQLDVLALHLLMHSLTISSSAGVVDLSSLQVEHVLSHHIEFRE